MRERTLVAYLDALLPTEPGAALPGAAEIAVRLTALAPRLPRLARAGLFAGGVLLEVSPLFVLGRVSSFARLSRPDRRRILERWGDSRIAVVRDLASLMRALSFVVYYDDQRVTAAVGWHVEPHIAAVNAEPPAEARRSLQGGAAAPGIR